MPPRAKLELARNFWDEMGRGHASAMHGPMLDSLAHHLRLDLRADCIVWEALALANTMAGLAANRHYAYHAVGALGVVELTAPGRAAQIAALRDLIATWVRLAIFQTMSEPEGDILVRRIDDHDGTRSFLVPLRAGGEDNGDPELRSSSGSRDVTGR